MRFDRTIRDIHESNEFFDIDYQDLLDNFDTVAADEEEKVPLSIKLSLVNVAFIDNIRGPISRPKYIDRILSIFRKEMIEDIRYRLENDKDKSSQNNT